MDNPFRYEPGFTIEKHRDELIERLGKAIKQINDLEAENIRLATRVNELLSITAWSH